MCEVLKAAFGSHWALREQNKREAELTDSGATALMGCSYKIIFHAGLWLGVSWSQVMLISEHSNNIPIHGLYIVYEHFQAQYGFKWCRLIPNIWLSCIGQVTKWYSNISLTMNTTYCTSRCSRPFPPCNNNNICHLADAFIQSDLQSCVHTFYVWVVPGIEPTNCSSDHSHQIFSHQIFSHQIFFRADLICQNSNYWREKKQSQNWAACVNWSAIEVSLLLTDSHSFPEHILSLSTMVCLRLT
jgi:hypothetical protein